MNKALIFALGFAAGSVPFLMTQVYLLNDKLTSAQIDLEHRDTEIEDLKRKLESMPRYYKHGRGPQVVSHSPKNPIGFSC